MLIRLVKKNRYDDNPEINDPIKNFEDKFPLNEPNELHELEKKLKNDVEFRKQIVSTL